MSKILKGDAYATGLYRDCPTKYDLRINKSLVTKERGGGKGFGSVLHKGREVWRLSLMAGDAPELALEKGLNAIELEHCGAFPSAIKIDEKRSLENAIALFKGYTAKFINQGYVPKQIEIPFDIEVGVSPRGNVIHRTGIFDELCEYAGRPYVLDFKSTAVYPGASWMDGWRTNDQFMGYLWAARQVFGEAHGVIVHGVWVHTPAKTTRSKYKFEDYFTSDIITFTNAQLDEWKAKFLRLMDRLEGDKATGLYDSNWGTACKAYGTLCEFHKWCSSDPGVRPIVENIYYERVAWTPLAEERLSQLAA